MKKYIIHALCLFAAHFSFLSSSSTAASTLKQNTEEMLEGAKVGEFIPLSTLFTGNYDHACIIPPYTDRISYEPSLDVLVNSHLSNIKYKGAESEWSLALINIDKVEIIIFKREKNLDILSENDFKNFVGFNKNFIPSNCTLINKGSFLKLSFRDRNYVVLGDSK